MEKIQQLLKEYKDKLWDYCNNIEYSDGYIYCYDTSGCISGSMSLSDLLFNTPFLSWLEWKDDTLISWIRDRGNTRLLSEPREISDYHKINLALLSTDSERIEYLESNTL